MSCMSITLIYLWLVIMMKGQKYLLCHIVQEAGWGEEKTCKAVPKISENTCRQCLSSCWEAWERKGHSSPKMCSAVGEHVKQSSCLENSETDRLDFLGEFLDKQMKNIDYLEYQIVDQKEIDELVQQDDLLKNLLSH